MTKHVPDLHMHLALVVFGHPGAYLCTHSIASANLFHDSIVSNLSNRYVCLVKSLPHVAMNVQICVIHGYNEAYGGLGKQ